MLAWLLLVSAPSAPAPLAQLAGTYDCVHPHWSDTVTLAADGTYARGNGDPGKWTFDSKQVVLGWKNWGPEPLLYTAPGVFTDAKKGFTCTLRDPPEYKDIPGAYQGKHPHWSDNVTLAADGTYKRGNGDPGRWVFDGKSLVLCWFNWGREPLAASGPGRFVDKAKGFSLTKRDALVSPTPPPTPAPVAAKHLRLDKATYKVGEQITVSYFHMPANGSDWTNIVPVGTATDEWGDWEYTSGEAEGQRVIKKKLAPGQWEARAYFSGETELRDRVRFTVVP